MIGVRLTVLGIIIDNCIYLATFVYIIHTKIGSIMYGR